jgi:hypothetical protein
MILGLFASHRDGREQMGLKSVPWIEDIRENPGHWLCAAPDLFD